MPVVSVAPPSPTLAPTPIAAPAPRPAPVQAESGADAPRAANRFAPSPYAAYIPKPTVPRHVAVERPPYVPSIPDAHAPMLTTEPPADFRAVPPAAPIPPAPLLPRLLSMGTPFPDDVAQALATMVETPVTAGGVATYFSPLLPHCTWVVTGARVSPPGVSFDLSAIDRLGQIAFAATCRVARHRSGALELHLTNAHVDPTYRQWGLTSQGEQRTGAMLQALSAHPDSRITLAAGFMDNPNTGAPQLGIGTYLHARRGYLFADGCSITSPFFDFEDGLKAHGERAMQRALDHWLRDEPSLTYKGASVTSGRRRWLRDQLVNCRLPYQFAELDVPGFTAQVPEQATALPLGQAFMLSGKAPVWCGVRFVNPPASSTTVGMRKLREKSAARFATAAERERERTEARRRSVTQSLWMGFNSPRAADRAIAYKTMGLFGDTALLGYLRARRQEETDPAALEKLRGAKKRLHGEIMMQGLMAATQDSGRPPAVRAGFVERLAAVQAARSA